MVYQLQGFKSSETDCGCDAERTSDTLKDAKIQAKYMLSEEYQKASEASAKLEVVQIWKGKELVKEFWQED